MTPGGDAVAASLGSVTAVLSATALLATMGMTGAVLDSLILMLYLLVSWIALNLVDSFFIRRGHYAITGILRLDGACRRWGWRGFAAYFGTAAEAAG